MKNSIKVGTGLGLLRLMVMFSQKETVCGLETVKHWFFKIHFLWVSSFIWIVSFITCLTVSIIFPDQQDPPIGTYYQSRFHKFQQFDSNSIFTIEDDNDSGHEFNIAEAPDQTESLSNGLFDKIFKFYLKIMKPLPTKDENIESESSMSQTKEERNIINYLSIGIATAHIFIIVYFSV